METLERFGPNCKISKKTGPCERFRKKTLKTSWVRKRLQSSTTIFGQNALILGHNKNVQLCGIKILKSLFRKYSFKDSEKVFGSSRLSFFEKFKHYKVPSQS